MARTAIKTEASREDKRHYLKRRSPTTPQKLVPRAEIILAAAEGLSNKSISKKVT
jgi:DNA-binding NarL/FixJ family response regulator